MRLRLRTLAVVAAGALGVSLIAVPAAAGALSFGPAPAEWVGTAPIVPGGGSCAQPGFNSIQAAVNAAASNENIHLCSGVYVGQVQIEKSVTILGQNSPTIELPASPANSTTDCDADIPNSYQPNQDEISICGAIKVELSGVVINASWPADTCYDSLYGIFVAGGATLTFLQSAIEAAGAQPINGCQGGVGIQTGTSRTSPNEVGHLVAKGSAVSGYQKNGIDIAGVGSTGTLTNNTIIGAGPTTAIAQNGVEVIDGGVATLTGNTISGDECDVAEVCGANSIEDTQSAGVLLFGSGANTKVLQNTISQNDIGVYNLANPNAAAPTKSLTTINSNKLENNRYEAVCLDQGNATLNSNTYVGGDVGLQAIQYFGQTFGGNYTAGRENITGQSVAAVQVLSDQNAADPSGVLTVNNSHFHGGSVLDNSSTYRLVLHSDAP